MKIKYIEYNSLSHLKISDKYKNVYILKILYDQSLVYQGRLYKSGNYEKWYSKLFTTEIEAAKEVDLELIRRGKDPVNILKKIR